MVGNKFLQDDGEDDDVVCSEWAASGGLELNQLKKLEIEFLNAIVSIQFMNQYDWNIRITTNHNSIFFSSTGLEHICE